MSVSETSTKTIAGGIALAIIATAALTGVFLLTGMGEDIKERWEKDSEWCESHGGELMAGDGMGVHADNHCTLSDGTTIHMSQVVEEDYPDNLSQITEKKYATHETTPPLTIFRPLTGFSIIPVFGLIVGSVFVVGFIRRRRGGEQ